MISVRMEPLGFRRLFQEIGADDHLKDYYTVGMVLYLHRPVVKVSFK